jgi:two-component system, NarL family, nitrate/nitrite response regulator NarL
LRAGYAPAMRIEHGQRRKFSETPMSGPQKTRVFLVSDIRVYRDGVSRLVAAEIALELAGAGTTAQSPSLLREVARPDVVLVDATQRADLVVTQEIATAARGANLVALVAPDEVLDLRDWAGAGVSGFLSWEASSDQVVDVLTRAARGESPCSPDIADAFLRRSRERPEAGLGVDGSLTKREAQVAELVADGLSNKAIASRLSIELATVKNHVHRILEKLRVHSRGEAAAKLRQPGIGRSA